MAAREVVIKPVTDKRVADAIDKALSTSKKKQDKINKVRKSVKKLLS